MEQYGYRFSITGCMFEDITVPAIVVVWQDNGLKLENYVVNS